MLLRALQILRIQLQSSVNLRLAHVFVWTCVLNCYANASVLRSVLMQLVNLALAYFNAVPVNAVLKKLESVPFSIHFGMNINI